MNLHLAGPTSGRPASDVTTSPQIRLDALFKPARFLTSQRGPKIQLSERIPQRQAFSVDILVAITELCLQGVFSDAVLCDILALFSLGDVDQDFCERESDTELLSTFLHEGLLPRAASIRARFKEGDPIADVMSILESMQRLKKAKEARSSQAVRRAVPHLPCSDGAREADLGQMGGPLTSSAQPSWLKDLRSSPKRNKWAPLFTSSIHKHSRRKGKHINVIDVLNGHATATR